MRILVLVHRSGRLLLYSAKRYTAALPLLAPLPTIRCWYSSRSKRIHTHTQTRIVYLSHLCLHSVPHSPSLFIGCAYITINKTLKSSRLHIDECGPLILCPYLLYALLIHAIYSPCKCFSLSLSLSLPLFFFRLCRQLCLFVALVIVFDAFVPFFFFFPRDE